MRKKIFGLIVVLLGIQLIPSTRNQGEVVVDKDFMSVYNPPAEITKIIQNSCYDCHSNNTVYPWYSSLQPIRFIMDNHVKNGKKELNFNEYANYSKRRQKTKLKSIYNQLNQKKMPLKSYTLIHKKARLKDFEIDIVSNWISEVQDSLINEKNR